MGLQTRTKSLVKVRKGQHGTIKVTPLGGGRFEIDAPAAMEIQQIRGRPSTSGARRRRRNRTRGFQK